MSKLGFCKTCGFLDTDKCKGWKEDCPNLAHSVNLGVYPHKEQMAEEEDSIYFNYLCMQLLSYSAKVGISLSKIVLVKVPCYAIDIVTSAYEWAMMFGSKQVTILDKDFVPTEKEKNILNQIPNHSDVPDIHGKQR